MKGQEEKKSREKERLVSNREGRQNKREYLRKCTR